MYKMRLLLLIILVSMAISSCLASPGSDRQSSIITFAYPSNTSRSIESLEQIPPLPPWEEVASLPLLGTSELRSSDQIALLRTYNGNDEIWIIRDLWSTVDMLSSKVMTQILVYQSETRTWSEIPAEIIDSKAVVFAIHMGSDGRIWAEGAIEHPIIFGDRSLAVFNPGKKRFDLVEDLNNTDHAVFVLDPQGFFWIIKDLDGIYSFDPITREYKQHLVVPDLITNGSSGKVALAPDGTLYISSINSGSPEPTTSLLHYNPATGELAHIDIQIESLVRLYDLFLDNSGRLWLDDIGWLESDGTWYQVVRSPVFISERVEGSSQFTWPTARVIYESSDGRIWFDSPNGEAWLDPRAEKWCWFTTEGGNVIEDHNRVLWTTANGLLYRLPITP